MIATLLTLTLLAAQPVEPAQPKPYYALIGKPHSAIAAEPGKTIAIEFWPAIQEAHRGDTIEIVVSVRSTSGVDELFTVFDFPFMFPGLTLVSAEPILGSDWMLAEFYNDQWLDGFNNDHETNAYFTLWSYPLRFHGAATTGTQMLVLTFKVPLDGPIGGRMVQCQPGGTWAVPAAFDDEIGAYNLATCGSYAMVNVVAGPPSDCQPDMLCNLPLDLETTAMLLRCLEGPE